METNDKKETTRRRLSELEMEAEVIIDRYFAEVAENPVSGVTVQLRQNLAAVRREQEQLFMQLSRLSSAA